MRRPKLLIPILLTLSVSLGSGYWLGTRASDTTELQHQRLRMDALRGQSDLLLEAFWSQVGQLRVRAESLGALRPKAPAPKPTPDGAILHWARFKVSEGNVMGLEDEARNAAWKTPDPAPFIKEYLLHVVKEIKMSEAERDGVATLPVRPDKGARKEWLALGFLAQGDTALFVVLVDPMDAFPFFAQFSRHSRAGKKRAYLLSRPGNVLAHSTPTYVGSDFSGTTLFKRAIQSVFGGKRLSGAGGYKAIDSLDVVAAYNRIGQLPLAIVVEQANPIVAPGKGLDPEVIRILGLLAALALGVVWILRRRVSRALAAALEAQTLRRQAVDEQASAAEALRAATPATPAEAVRAESPGGATGAAREPEDEATPEVERISPTVVLGTEPPPEPKQLAELLVSEFQLEATQSSDMKAITSRLAQVTSRLCQSPVLYFGFNARIQTALLQATAGFHKNQAPATLTFPIHLNALQRILQFARENKLASLSRYEPLAALMLNRFGVGHFEAWAMTSNLSPTRPGPAPQLFGVLVILHSGVLSHSNRDPLIRMMRTAGYIYEETRQ